MIFRKNSIFNFFLVFLQSLEKFSALTTLVAANLEIYMRQIHDTEFPNSVEATEELLIEQGSEYTRLKVILRQLYFLKTNNNTN